MLPSSQTSCRIPAENPTLLISRATSWILKVGESQLGFTPLLKGGGPEERSWCSSRMILVNSKICSTYVCTKGVCIHFSPLSLSHLVTEISVKLWIWLGSLKFWTPCPAERQRLYRRNANLISHWPGHASQLSTSIQSNSSILVKTVTRYSLLKHSAFSFLHA